MSIRSINITLFEVRSPFLNRISMKRPTQRVIGQVVSVACRVTFRVAVVMLAAVGGSACGAACHAGELPHIILVMADDMGWGQTGYRNHPVLKTPNLDAMAAGGLRFQRFYSGGPVCSPTRASVLTGRTHDRAGVLTHGYALRIQEQTIPQVLREAGYVTGHFGKWHLNGYRGPGAPILANDPRHPGRFGFDEWVSVSNFFDLDPLMSRAGKVEEAKGDSSEVAVANAIEFIDRNRGGDQPIFAVIWFGSPHSPFKSLDADKAAFGDLDEASANHYGELVAMDRSIGTLRRGLREMGIADNTLLVFCSDNGGLPNISPGTVGGLRGFKGSLYEGGIRVPGIIEWPIRIKPRVTDYPACVMDLFPTIRAIVGFTDEAMVKPIDGISLKPLFERPLEERGAPIGFRHHSKRALVDDRYKLVTEGVRSDRFQLYDLIDDPQESRDLSGELPEVYARMRSQLLEWDRGVDASFAGKDYPEGRVAPPDLPSVDWSTAPDYQPYLGEWRKRWEYQGYLNRRGARPGAGGQPRRNNAQPERDGARRGGVENEVGE